VAVAAAGLLVVALPATDAMGFAIAAGLGLYQVTKGRARPALAS